ncbi:hypothetical protein B0O99DRAFT_639551 [Bisporella sp. PMI_857]|nr:hypothetical protein B0O99DRAFT_639551 [Bisporella sp. PMI_857]
MYVFILLISLRECGASDPRDKVFAVLGVLETHLPAASVYKIRPNYHETYTTRDAYTEITKMLLKMLPNLWVLSFVGDPSLQNTELRLPSWVPDLTCPNVESMQNLKGHLSLYAAASSLQRVPYKGELLFDGFTLTLKGVYFDTIVESIPFKDDYWAHKIGRDEYVQRTGKRLSQWLEKVLQTSYDEPADSVLWKTITAGKSGTLGFPVIADKTFRDFVVYYMMKLCSNRASSATFNQLLATVRSFPTIHTAFKDLVALAAADNRGGPSAKYLETIAGLHQSTDIFTEAWGLQTPNHILFRTSKGRFGQGPVSLQPGEQVWLISNAQMPLVLRPVEGTDSFNLIGVAYIHGCMHGELVAEWGDKYQSVKIV